MGMVTFHLHYVIELREGQKTLHDDFTPDLSRLIGVYKSWKNKETTSQKQYIPVPQITPLSTCEQ